jgi:hypothetical protein
MVKEWRDFCESEWGLTDDEGSDSLMIASYLGDLEKLQKRGGEPHNYLSQNCRRRLRELGILLPAGSGGTKLDWSKIEYYVSLLPTPIKVK